MDAKEMTEGVAAPKLNPLRFEALNSSPKDMDLNDFIAKRIRIVKAFRQMGASYTQIVWEFHKLCVDRMYYDEWDQAVLC